MDVMTAFAKVAAPPLAFFFLLFLLPPLCFFRLFLSAVSSLFPENMRDKVVLITGASSGIGEQIAYQYAKRGACLALVARREDRLKTIAERAAGLGCPDALVVSADVSKPEDCKRIVEVTMNHFGRLNHLVTNAGILSMFLFEDAMEPANYAPVLDTNFWGSIHTTFFALPHLKKSHGRILVTSAVTSYLPAARLSFYNASKAALTNFYETLRIELFGDVGITILMPGLTESEISQGKFLSREGDMTVDQEMRDVEMALTPVNYAENCAKDAVEAACRGRRYVVSPSWFRIFFWVWTMAPELFEWTSRWFYFTRLGGSERDALSRKLFDASGLKRWLYPESLRSTTPQPAPASASAKIKKTE